MCDRYMSGTVCETVDEETNMLRKCSDANMKC